MLLYNTILLSKWTVTALRLTGFYLDPATIKHLRLRALKLSFASWEPKTTGILRPILNRAVPRSDRGNDNSDLGDWRLGCATEDDKGDTWYN